MKWDWSKFRSLHIPTSQGCSLLTCESIVVYNIALLIPCSHDEIAKFLGVPATPFDVMFPDKAKEMKRMVLDYIKVLRRDHLGHSQTPANINNGLQTNTLEINEAGYPIAPQPQSWTKVKRDNLESIYRLYIARHYRKSYFSLILIMVKGFQNSQVEMSSGRHLLKELPETIRIL
jgi:hypothetical protein